MKRVLLIFIPILVMAKFYSIQLYTSSSKSYAEKFLNSLPLNIKNKSFLYITNSKKYTVRYLISDKIYKLRPFTKNLKNFSFVEDSYEKIKYILKPQKIKKILPKSNTPNKQPAKKIKTSHKKTPLSLALTNELKMTIAIYEYNKDKINYLLNKKDIPPYQRIEANYKLKRFKIVQDKIFNSYNPNAQIYETYFDTIKKINNFISFHVDIKKDFLTNNLKMRSDGYLVEVQTINGDSKQILISKKFLDYLLSVGYENSNNSSPLLKLSKGNRHYTYYIAYHQNIVNLDKVAKKAYTTKQDLIGAKFFNISNYDNTTFKAEFSKNNDKQYNNKYYQTLLELYNEHRIYAPLQFISYIDNVHYSSIYDNYSELGLGLSYQNMQTSSKKIKFIITPLILYNTNTKFGYNFGIKLHRRIIKADDLSFLISINSYENDIQIVYIYYF